MGCEFCQFLLKRTKVSLHDIHLIKLVFTIPDINTYTGLITMQVISDIKQAQLLCQKWRDQGESISFVPTMGCLHDGHLSLIKKAQTLADHVVVSIFINPLQFDDPQDLLKYPSTIDEDLLKLTDNQVELVFTPNAQTFYPEGEENVQQIELGQITSVLEGEKRPGHFAGVATVVKRLFDLIKPTYALFGEKDFQQLIVINHLVKQFSLDVQIIAMPIFREQNGLAMSSRNVRLTEVEQVKAAEIYRQLVSIKEKLNTGITNYAVLEQESFKSLRKAGFIPEYVAICDAETLQPANNRSKEMVILLAAKLGKIRLIDNLRV